MVETFSRVHDNILVYRNKSNLQIIRVESDKWWKWLKYENVDTFDYQSRWGDFIASRVRKDGCCYWYACHACEQASVKIYLGHCTDLTVGHLQRSAAMLIKKHALALYAPLSLRKEYSAYTDDRICNDPHAGEQQGEKQDLSSLSQREIEVVRYIMVGLPNGVIAEKMCIAESTVRWYLKSIYLKLHIHNRVQLALWAKSLFSYPPPIR